MEEGAPECRTHKGVTVGRGMSGTGIPIPNTFISRVNGSLCAMIRLYPLHSESSDVVYTVQAHYLLTFTHVNVDVCIFCISIV